MRQLLLLGLLALLSGVATAAEPPAEWKLPEADGQKWAARVTQAVGRSDNWSIELRGNEIIVRRKQPVKMVRTFPNAPPGDDKPTPDGEKPIQFVLRFAPKMSLDEYDRLAAENAASAKEYDRLERAINDVAHKFDDYVAANPEQQARLDAFHTAVAKLPHHTLPELYTTDHSVYFFHPWDGWSGPADKMVSAECEEVEDTLMRLFGMYDPAAAVPRSRQVGQYLPERQ
jgi:hypothetical protein